MPNETLQPGLKRPAPSLSSVAIRTRHHNAMVAFYSEAMETTFHTAHAGPIEYRFADIGGILLKLVPIRERADFTGFPVHQLGFGVADVAAVAALAIKHGGRIHDAPTLMEGRLQASVRDPDGNTIELYAAIPR